MSDSHTSHKVTGIPLPILCIVSFKATVLTTFTILGIRAFWKKKGNESWKMISVLASYVFIIGMMFTYDLFMHKITILYHTVLLSQFFQFVGIYFNIRRINKFIDDKCLKKLSCIIYFVWLLQLGLFIIGFLPEYGSSCSDTNIYPLCMQFLLYLYIPEFFLIWSLNRHNYFKEEAKINKMLLYDQNEIQMLPKHMKCRDKCRVCCRGEKGYFNMLTIQREQTLAFQKMNIIHTIFAVHLWIYMYQNQQSFNKLGE